MTATDLVLIVATFFFASIFVGPHVGARLTRHRQARRELSRCGGVVRPITSAPHFTRDPSPRPRDAA